MSTKRPKILGTFKISIGSGPKRKERYTSNHENEALIEAIGLDEELHSQQAVVLNATADFKLGKKAYTDTVIIWLNQKAEKELNVECPGIGYGLYKGARRKYSTVKYTNVSGQELLARISRDEEPEEPLEDENEEVEEIEVSETQEQTYAKAACEQCGLIQPVYALNTYSYEEEAGRSSGGSVQSSSTDYSPFEYRSGRTVEHSEISGQTFYRTVTTRLCDNCYKSYTDNDKRTSLFIVLLIGGLIFLGFILMLSSRH